jgi:phage baseplate assembly protein W
LFLTGTGQRYLNPTFGAGLQVYIFEQLNSNTEVALEEDIQSIISEYFPSVIVENLTVTGNPDTNQITVALKYSIRDTGVTDNLEISFN